MDFLGQGIGGMQQAQGPNMTGGAGVGAPQPIGPTYGQLAKGAMQYGSKPGSSTPMLAQAMPTGRGMYGQQQLAPLDPNAPPQAKATNGQPSEGGDDSLAQIATFLMQMIGGV